jgi:hypothetical protein
MMPHKACRPLNPAHILHLALYYIHPLQPPKIDNFLLKIPQVHEINTAINTSCQAIQDFIVSSNYNPKVLPLDLLNWKQRKIQMWLPVVKPHCGGHHCDADFGLQQTI